MARLSMSLEVRWLPTAMPLVVEPNETIDQAEDLGTLNQPAAVMGSIGNGPAGLADVTWFHFKSVDPAKVDLDISTPAGIRHSRVSSACTTTIPRTSAIRTTWTAIACWPRCRRARRTGPSITPRDLGPGDYFVAVSGAGNLDFSPVLAGSGYDGASGSYELTIAATDLGLAGSVPWSSRPIRPPARSLIVLHWRFAWR